MKNPILVEIRYHRKAYLDFLEFLKTTDIASIETYLKVKDMLAYGYILDYLLSKHLSIVIGTSSIKVIINRDFINYYPTIKEINDIHYAYYVDNLEPCNTNFSNRLNAAIMVCFKTIDDSILE